MFVCSTFWILETYNKDEEAAGWGDVLLSSPMQGYWVDLYNAMFTFPAYAALIPGNNFIYVTINVHQFLFITSSSPFMYLMKVSQFSYLVSSYTNWCLGLNFLCRCLILELNLSLSFALMLIPSSCITESLSIIFLSFLFGLVLFDLV